MHNQMALSYEEEANMRLNRNESLEAAILFKSAYGEYKKASNYQKSQQMLENASSASKEGWEEHKIQVQTPHINFDENNQYRLVTQIFAQEFMISNSTSIMNEHSNNHQLGLAVSHVRFNIDGPTIGPITSEQDINLSLIKQRKISVIKLGESFLASNVYRLEMEGKISSQTLINYINDFGILDKRTTYLISCGIERHLQNDYFSSCHILIAQVEPVLRQLLSTRNYSTKKEKEGIIMENELGGLINKAKDFLEDFTEKGIT